MRPLHHGLDAIGNQFAAKAVNISCPPCPMAMPSSIPMVLKINGTRRLRGTQAFNQQPDFISSAHGRECIIGVAVHDAMNGFVEIAFFLNGTSGAEQACDAARVSMPFLMISEYIFYFGYVVCQ